VFLLLLLLLKFHERKKQEFFVGHSFDHLWHVSCLFQIYSVLIISHHLISNFFFLNECVHSIDKIQLFVSRMFILHMHFLFSIILSRAIFTISLLLCIRISYITSTDPVNENSIISRVNIFFFLFIYLSKEFICIW